MRVKWSEANVIKLELLGKFKEANDGHFSYERKFSFKGKKYLKVGVYGIKQGNLAQYDVVIECNLGKFRGEVKRSSMLIKTDVEPTTKNVIEYLNKVLAILDLIQALTVIPSDCGTVDVLEVHFTKIDGNYHEKTVKIPLR